MIKIITIKCEMNYAHDNLRIIEEKNKFTKKMPHIFHDKKEIVYIIHNFYNLIFIT